MSVELWGSIALALGALTCSWVIGNRWRWGHLLALGLQCGWIAYAILTEQWGFAGSSALFAVLNVRNYRLWKRLDERDRARECACRGEEARV